LHYILAHYGDADGAAAAAAAAAAVTVMVVWLRGWVVAWCCCLRWRRWRNQALFILREIYAHQNLFIFQQW
jgi:hypothetical protein